MTSQSDLFYTNACREGTGQLYLITLITPDYTSSQLFMNDKKTKTQITGSEYNRQYHQQRRANLTPAGLELERERLRRNTRNCRDKKKQQLAILSPGTARWKNDCERSKRHSEKKKCELENLPPEEKAAIIAISWADNREKSRPHREKKKTSHNKQGPLKSVLFQIHKDKEMTSTMFGGLGFLYPRLTVTAATPQAAMPQAAGTLLQPTPSQLQRSARKQECL